MLSLIRTSVHLLSQTGRQILDFYINCGKIYFSFLTNFASPEKWSMQGICSSSPSPKFTFARYFNSTAVFIACTQKIRNGFGKTCRPSFRKMPNHITTSFNCDCVFVILVLWFWSSFENFSIFGSPLRHVSMITFDMSFLIVFLDQKYW